MFNLLIQNGLLHDGSGGAPRRADVAVAGGRIAALGDLSAAEAKDRIDAAGCLVCPGFIDVHTHSDAYLLIEPSAPSKIFQGVTTEIVGNCGASAAPLLGAYQMPSDWRSKEYPGRWSTLAEYRALLEQAHPAVNVGFLVGHNTLRAGIVGYDARPATANELRRMEAMLEECLAAGALGLSSGLIYPPGLYAPSEELVALNRAVGRCKGIYTSHMRSESRGLLDAIRETIGIGETTGCRIEISHLKTSGRANWPLVEPALALIEEARARGVRVAADRYPYTASCTDLDVILPAWAEEGGRDAILARLRDPAIRARIRAELLERRGPDDWAAILIGSTIHPDNRAYRGRRLTDAARELNLEPVDAALHLMLSDELQTGGIFFGMSEENMWRILAQPWVMIGSDASIRAPEGPLSTDFPHPRAYGSFPLFLRAALDGRTVSVAEAIRKMTSLPAEHFGLKQRGRLAEDYFADIVVIDPAELRATATYEAPHQLARGVRALVVNGVETLRAGIPTNQRAGRFLERSG